MACQTCGTALPVVAGRGRPRLFCLSCAADSQKYRRSYRNKVLALLGGKCVSCGSTTHLEISHNNRDGKDERRRFQELAFLRRIILGVRPTDDLSLRCFACHRAYDAIPHAKVTHCPQGHPYDETNLYVSPSGASYCRACKREKWQAWKKEHRPQINAYYQRRHAS